MKEIHSDIYSNLLEKNSRRRLKITSCKLDGDCPLFRRGACVHGHPRACPYGHLGVTQTPTPRSRKFSAELAKLKKRCDELENLVDFRHAATECIAFVGEHVLLPYRFMRGEIIDGVKGFDFFGDFIPREQFTTGAIDRIVKHRPYTFFDHQPIEEYPQHIVPRFVFQLRHVAPEVYDEAAQSVDLESIYQRAITNVVPCPLSIGLVEPGTPIVLGNNSPATWDGERLSVSTKPRATNLWDVDKDIYVEPGSEVDVSVKPDRKRTLVRFADKEQWLAFCERNPEYFTTEVAK